MARWKCKHCGCENFSEHYMNGYRKYGEYDEEGEPIDGTIEDDAPELEIECEECGNRGLHLTNIAELVK